MLDIGELRPCSCQCTRTCSASEGARARWREREAHSATRIREAPACGIRARAGRVPDVSSSVAPTRLLLDAGTFTHGARR